MKKFCLLVITIVAFALSGIVFASGVYTKTKVIDAQNLWTDAIPISIGCSANIRIHPDTSPIMTIHAQCRYKGETTWYDMDHWDLTAASVDIICTTAQPEPEPAQMRLGCKTGEYTSGNCTVRVGTGRLP
jgi:hypothetical protein